MPSKGRGKISTKTKARYAEGKLAGKTNRQISAELGVAASTGVKLAADPEVHSLTERILRRAEQKLDGLVAKTLASLERDLEAAKFDERERARTQALKILELGKPPEPAPGAGANSPGVFLGDLLVHYQRLTASPQKPGA